MCVLAVLFCSVCVGRGLLFGVDDIHHGHGQVAPLHHLHIRLPHPHLGGEDLGVALAAEEDGPLVKYAQALHRHRRRAAEIRLERHVVEKAHIHGVEAPVEAHRLHIQSNVERLHKEAFEQEDYEASDTVKEMSAAIVKKTGYSK